MDRVWDRFLTERDQEHLRARPILPVGFGHRPAVLMVDNFRQAVGDEPLPVMKAIETWPHATGSEAWAALEHIDTLLTDARGSGIPIVHVTGLEEEESQVPGWWESRTGGNSRPISAEQFDRYRRRYEIVDQAAPLPGEGVLRKSAPSAFWGTPLIAWLVHRRIDTLIVGGESTSGCVRATVVDAASHRLRVIVAEECTYDRVEASHAISLFDMHRKYADVLPLDTIRTWIRRTVSERTRI